MTSTLEPTTTALPPLKLGALAVDPPVVLAPMAGVTNPAFRALCREFGAGLYVCEMITTRALVERNEKTLRMVRATADEKAAFSVQLYGVDPATVGRAVEMLVDEGVAGTRPAHIDLNFGCPVPKVTRKGGGSALPWRRVLFRDIVRAAVRAARRRPGHGQDPHGHRRRPRHLPRRRADGAGRGRRGDRAARPHRRPALQRHRRLVAHRAAGRGASTSRCSATATSGRPTTRCGWSPRPAATASSSGAAAWAGRGCSATWPPRSPGRRSARCPRWREVAAIMHRHATLLAAEHGERHGCSDFRKHVAWYLKGFSVGSDIRRALAMVSSLDELAGLLARIDRPALSGRRPRCSAGAHHRAAPGGPARGLARRPGRPEAAGRSRARGERRMSDARTTVEGASQRAPASEERIETGVEP